MSEEREQAVEIMRALPRSLRRTFREANVLVAMLEPLCSDKVKSLDDRYIAISRSMLKSLCILAEGLRDALSVPAQQTRTIAHLLGQDDAWEQTNGVPVDEQ